MRINLPKIAHRMLAFGVAFSAAALMFNVFSPAPAQACGGFFCNQSAPVNQQSEQILFTVSEGSVSATIQINYVGEAEDFAWVVPVASIPTIGVGTADVFTELGWRTSPKHYVELYFK